MDAYRRKPGQSFRGEWESIPHLSLEDLRPGANFNAKDVDSALRAHRFQDEEAPGLYPVQPTVCSCGASPKRAPDDDYEWWIEHLLTEVWGT